MVKNPNILLSLINTKLRDEYESLDDLCSSLDYDKDEINDILNKEGYFYNEKLNQFKIK